MTRLPKGALVGRITASILASAILMSTVLPVSASESDRIQSLDTTVKTLPPLPETSSPQEAATTPDAMPPAEATATSHNGPKPRLQFIPEPGAQPSNSTTSNDAWNSAPAPVAATNGDAGAPGTASSDNPVAVAPPEVTEPQPLNTNSDAADQPKELAQALQPDKPRTPTDPVLTKQPVTRGTVQIKRAFTRFPTSQIIHNLSFRDTPVKEVIAEIGRRGNLNMIIDKSAIGRITGDLHDLTLNEAMDTVLTSAGLYWRQLDNSTVIIGAPSALTILGLNRPMLRVFKLNYSSAFDVAQILWASCFNRGFLPDFSVAVRNRLIDQTKTIPNHKTIDEQYRTASTPTAGGGSQLTKTTDYNLSTLTGNDEREVGDEASYTTRLEASRTVRGSIREQTNEGSGYNSGAMDPGSEVIRSVINIVSDYAVDQNGGGAICIPDQRNRQVIVCGTQDDINIAEETIRLIDRRPRQVHIQSSLVELNNQGIRQLGAALNLQGAGASGTVLGGSGAPMVNFLPGLGAVGSSTVTTGFTNPGAGITTSQTSNVVGISPVAQSFTLTNGGGTSTFSRASNISPTGFFGNGFTGVLGAALPILTPTIAGVNALNSAASMFNFLTLNKAAGGRSNIATVPVGLNLSLNLVLQTNKAKLLANPSVIVDDNTEALITLANEVVHKVTTTVSLGVVSTNVELVKAGIFLDVLPKIGEDGFVTMRIRPQVSSPLGGPQEFANGSVVVTLLNVREVMAQEVRVKDGQTLVIGGLFTEQEAASLSKVPYLAEAPILGALFRNTIKGRNRTELMLLITPKIVEDPPPSTLGELGGPATL